MLIPSARKRKGKKMKEKGLSGNALKIIAMLTMLIDHAGLILFGDFLPFRIIGRLAFPIYAYLIAEGCFYTKKKGRHFLEIFVLGVICQAGYYIAEGDLYLNVLLTFSLSVPLVYLVLSAKKKKAMISCLLLALLLTVLLCERLASFGVYFDYGTAGILLPVLISLGNDKKQRLALFAVGLLALSFSVAPSLPYQWFCLFAILPLFFYNGRRGALKLKRFFYLFYPVHILALYGISLIL